MKINAKKILSFVMLIAIMLLSLSMAVFAAEESGATSGTTGQPQPGGANMWLVIVIYVAFFGVVGYFLIFRPNKKRKKQEEELRNSIILGDEVTTIGGIVGRVVNIKDDNITIKNWAIREVKKPITDDVPEKPAQEEKTPEIEEKNDKKNKKDKK